MQTQTSKKGWRHWLAPHGWKREVKVAVIWSLAIVVFITVMTLWDTDADAATGTVATVEVEPGDELWFQAEADEAGELMRLAPTCGDVCGTKSRDAARKFRNNRIDKANGFRPDRVFRSPATAKRVYAAKYKRLIHKRWHSTSLLREFALAESGAPCTADTLACGEEWYDKAVMSRCIAEHSPFPADENACTEIVALDVEQRYTEENIKNTGAVFFCAGGIGLAIGTGGFGAYFGATSGCWSAYWAINGGG